MGGPQVNIMQLLAAGQADCIMGSSDLQIMKAREQGLPRRSRVAAAFQKDPQVLIAPRRRVKKIEDLKGKTILISADANTSYWPWLKAKFGLSDAQMRPYTFNIQPFVADKNTVQQGYLIERALRHREGSRRSSPTCSCSPTMAGRRTPPPSSCMEDTLKKQAQGGGSLRQGHACRAGRSYLKPTRRRPMR